MRPTVLRIRMCIRLSILHFGPKFARGIMMTQKCEPQRISHVISKGEGVPRACLNLRNQGMKFPGKILN